MRNKEHHGSFSSNKLLLLGSVLRFRQPRSSTGHTMIWESI